jgi:endonuclease-8
MPEGHTIHRLARDLRKDLAGRVVGATSPQLRFSAGARQIDGATLVTAGAHGKHLFVEFDPPSPDGVLHVHLGLFGRFRRSPTPTPTPTPLAEAVAGAGSAVRLRLEGDGSTWDLSGPTACELLDDGSVRRLLDRLGPDPLRRDAAPERFVSVVRASRRAIGALLLDQSVVAGVGNVYRSELCFRLGLDPRTPGRDLDDEQARALWADACDLLAIGVRLGRIVTVDPTGDGRPSRIAGRPASAARLRAGERVYVYRREHCLRCGAPVEWFDLANRRAYACPVEQPRHA